MRDAFRECHTFERRRDIPDLHGRATGKLAQDHLQKIKRLPYDEEDNDVRYQERAPAVLVCCERKPPDVAEADGHGDAGQQELPIVAPLLSFRLRGEKAHVSFEYSQFSIEEKISSIKRD